MFICFIVVKEIHFKPEDIALGIDCWLSPLKVPIIWIHLFNRSGITLRAVISMASRDNLFKRAPGLGIERSLWKITNWPPYLAWAQLGDYVHWSMKEPLGMLLSSSAYKPQEWLWLQRLIFRSGQTWNRLLRQLDILCFGFRYNRQIFVVDWAKMLYFLVKTHSLAHLQKFRVGVAVALRPS